LVRRSKGSLVTDWSGFEHYHFYPNTGLLWPFVVRGASARVLGALGDCISAYSKRILDTRGRLDGGERLAQLLILSIDATLCNGALDVALTGAIARIRDAC